MIKLTILTTVIITFMGISNTIHAAEFNDDGGFARHVNVNKAPTALGDYTVGDDANNFADIAPAAGDDEAEQNEDQNENKTDDQPQNTVKSD